MAKVPVVLVARGDLADLVGDMTWSRCTRCQQGVLIPARASANVTAGTWRALCFTCAHELAEARPELFADENWRDTPE